MSPTDKIHSRNVRIARKWRSLLLTLFCALLLAGCKIVIIVPPGGKVISDNGEQCLAGKTCIIEVNDTAYDDRFTAVADDNHVFLRWRKRDRGFCGLNWHSCRLFTSFIAGNEELEDILASGTEFYLEPVFVERTRYLVEQWATMLDEIDEDRFVSDAFLYEVMPNVQGCDAGVLSVDAKLRFWQTLNMIRALHDLPPVDYDSFYDMQMQESSLVQEANNYLSHFPDPADLCYTTEAEVGSGSANIIGGGLQGDPASHALGWTNDNRNVALLMAAGHRRWVLFPELGFTSFGLVGSSAAMKVFDFNQVPRIAPSPSLDFVAFPYRDYPYILVEKGGKPTPWSLSIVPLQGVSSQFDHFTHASVSVSDDQSGEELVVHSEYFDSDGFGLSNFYSWMVDDWEYDRDYTVVVSGIRMPGGNVQTLEYPVRLDRFNLLNIEKPLEKGDSNAGGVLSGTFKNPVDKDSYSLELSGSTSFALRSGQFVGGFFVLIYDGQKQLLKSADQAFSMNFPAGQYTVMITPCDIDGLCYQGIDSYSVTIE